MKKGIILTMSVQQNNTIQYTLQDQNYLPRLRNYLMLEHGDITWEKKAYFELTEENIQEYQVVACTALTQKFVKQLQRWKPDLQMIFLPTDQFMEAMAPRGFVFNMSTGYVLAEAPSVAIKDTPVNAEYQPYTNEDLRLLMQKYPTIYWEVVTLDDLKKKLDSKTINTTIALTPAAAPYRKLLASNYPTVPIIDARAEKNQQQSTLKDEQMMIAITCVTSLLLILLVLF
ncbi:hypothetical protein [Enterococcus larvae]|uniref:hypothetical protein n=1 Tax=Enterococcus larvae TaxID=2794352 RepID=UPI003F32A3E7